jgi:uncharacterized cupredoxin-like copper-binding protein
MREEKMQRRTVTLIEVSLLFVVIAGACGGSAGTGSAEISVSMAEFSFTPSIVSAPAGAEITLNLTNNGTVDHSWVLMQAGYTAEPPFSDADQSHVLQEFTLSPGEQQTATFTAPSDPGKYQVVCSLPGHLEAGMQGTFTFAE